MIEKCCEEYVHECSPKACREGRFFELHNCVKCGRELKIEFEGIALLGGATECVPVGILN